MQNYLSETWILKHTIGLFAQPSPLAESMVVAIERLHSSSCTLCGTAVTNTCEMSSLDVRWLFEARCGS